MYQIRNRLFDLTKKIYSRSQLKKKNENRIQNRMYNVIKTIEPLPHPYTLYFVWCALGKCSKIEESRAQEREKNNR